MRTTRMKKRMITGALTAILAAGLVLPASVSASPNTVTYKSCNTSNWLTYYYSIPWDLIFTQQPVKIPSQVPAGGTTQPSKPQTGTTQPGKPQTGEPQTGTTQPSKPQTGTNQPGKPQTGTNQPSKPQTGTSGNTGSNGQAGTGTTTTDKSQFATQVITLVNQERAKQGLRALTGDPALNNMALAKAQDMSQNNYFDHTSPTYGSPFDMMTKFGISYGYAGENIAMGQRTPAEVVNAWMNSEGHRANILNSHYTLIGVGYYNGYWAQEFVGR